MSRHFGVTLTPPVSTYWLQPHLVVALAPGRKEIWDCSCTVSLNAFASLSFPLADYLSKCTAISHAFHARRLEDHVGRFIQAMGGLFPLTTCFQLCLISTEFWERNTRPLFAWEKWSQELFMICPKLHSQGQRQNWNLGLLTIGHSFPFNGRTIVDLGKEEHFGTKTAHLTTVKLFQGEMKTNWN